MRYLTPGNIYPLYFITVYQFCWYCSKRLYKKKYINKMKAQFVCPTTSDYLQQFSIVTTSTKKGGNHMYGCLNFLWMFKKQYFFVWFSAQADKTCISMR